MSHRCAKFFLISVAVLFFADTFVGNRTMIPTGALYTEEPWRTENPGLAGDLPQQYDMIQQFYPWADFFKRSAGKGRFPIWNPYNYLGTPFLANPQTALLYPPTWLHLIMPLRYSFSIIFLLKLSLGLLGMYYWLRSGGLRPEACLIGGLTFGLSMNMVVSLAFPYSNVTVLFPWVLLAVKRAMESPSRGRFAALAATIAIIVFAGQPQAALPTFLAILLYALLLPLDPRGPAFSRLGWTLGAFAVAGLLSAVQWLPSFSYVAESMVSLGPRIVKSTLPFDLFNLVTFVVPDFFGGLGNYWGFPGYHYTAFYSSVLALLLAPFALRRSRSLTYPVVLGTIALGVILGLPVFESLLDLPGFNLLRRHRFSFLLIFALGHLSALGTEHLIRGLWARTAVLRVLALTSLLCISFFFLGVLEYREFLDKLDPTGMTYLSALWVFALLLAGAAVLLRTLTRPILLALILLVMLDLSWSSYNLNPRGNARSLFPKSQLASSLLERKPVPRIFSFHPIFNPNTAMVYGLQDVRGYDVITPRRLFRFMQEIDPDLGNILNWLYSLDPDDLHEWTLTRQAVGKALEDYGEELRRYYASESYWSVGINRVENRQFFDLLEIDYILGPASDELKDFEKVFPDQAVQVLKNPNAERCRLYFDWVESSVSETLERMKAYDLRASALVETRLPAPADLDHPPEFLLISRSGIEPNCYRVETDRSAVLVEFERFSPGWYALLDGKTLQEVFPAQHLFRGVFVPPGKHTVEFRYDPPAVRYGLAISLAGLFFLLAILSPDLLYRLRKRSSDGWSAR